MRLLIRADGYADIGTGHVMRMLALGEHAVAEGHHVDWAASMLDPALADRITQAGIALHEIDVEPGTDADVRAVVNLTRASTDWIAVDGYVFGGSYYAQLVGHSWGVLQIDDLADAPDYQTHLVLNQNANASPSAYGERSARTRLLLGPKYALIRNELRAAMNEPSDGPARADRILVTMGGADPVNATQPVVQALGQIEDPELEVRIVVGPSNPWLRQLEQATTDPRMMVVTGPGDFAQHVQWADLTVSAAGGTMYELCALSTPVLTVIIAENQRASAEAMADKGVCPTLGWHEDLTESLTMEMIQAVRTDRIGREERSRRGRALVDGGGCGRVLSIMCEENQ